MLDQSGTELLTFEGFLLLLLLLLSFNKNVLHYHIYVVEL